MTMHKVALVLACLACTCHGRRLATSNIFEQLVATEQSDTLGPAKSLAEVLLAFNPAGLTTLPKQRMHCREGLCKNVGTRDASFTKRLGSSPLMVPLEDREDFRSVVAVGSFLSLISGVVNVVAFLDMGIPVTHHTGSATHLGRCFGRASIAFGELVCGVAPKLFALIAGYAIGAGTCGWMAPDGEKVFKGKWSLGLLISAGVIAAATMLKYWTKGNIVLTLTLLAYSQGLQNAITTRCSSCPVRTTHMTGALTDMGASLGAYLKAKSAGRTLPSLRKPILFGSSILNYGLGGVLGHLAYASYGVLSMLFPAAFLAVMATGLRVHFTWDVPPLTVPQLKVPELKIPELEVPQLSIPQLKAPWRKAPTTSTSGESTPDELTLVESTSTESVSAETTLSDDSQAESTSAGSSSAEGTAAESISTAGTSPEFDLSEFFPAENAPARSPSAEIDSEESISAEVTPAKGTTAESTSAEGTSAESYVSEIFPADSFSAEVASYLSDESTSAEVASADSKLEPLQKSTSAESTSDESTSAEGTSPEFDLSEFFPAEGTSAVSPSAEGASYESTSAEFTSADSKLEELQLKSASAESASAESASAEGNDAGFDFFAPDESTSAGSPSAGSDSDVSTSAELTEAERRLEALQLRSRSSGSASVESTSAESSPAEGDSSGSTKAQ